MFSVCQSGHEKYSEDAQEAFPNLKTFMGYVGTSPLSGNGSEEHMKEWEKATKGRVTDLDRDKEIQSLRNKPGAGNAKNITIWSKDNNYQANPVDKKAADFETDFDSAFKGEVTDEASLLPIYNSAQYFLSEAAEGEKNHIQLRSNCLLRLRHYDKVSANFQIKYEDRIKETCEILGISAPDFSKLTRKEAVIKIEEIKEKIKAFTTGGLDSPMAKLDEEKRNKLFEGMDTIESFYTLSDDVKIPEVWIFKVIETKE